MRKNFFGGFIHTSVDGEAKYEFFTLQSSSKNATDLAAIFQKNIRQQKGKDYQNATVILTDSFSNLDEAYYAAARSSIKFASGAEAYQAYDDELEVARRNIAHWSHVTESETYEEWDPRTDKVKNKKRKKDIFASDSNYHLERVTDNRAEAQAEIQAGESDGVRRAEPAPRDPVRENNVPSADSSRPIFPEEPVNPTSGEPSTAEQIKQTLTEAGTFDGNTNTQHHVETNLGATNPKPRTIPDTPKPLPRGPGLSDKNVNPLLNELPENEKTMGHQTMARAQEMLDNKAAQELLDGKLPYRPDNIRRAIYPSDRARSIGSFGPGSSSYEYGGQTFGSFDALASHVQSEQFERTLDKQFGPFADQLDVQFNMVEDYHLNPGFNERRGIGPLGEPVPLAYSHAEGTFVGFDPVTGSKFDVSRNFLGQPVFYGQTTAHEYGVNAVTGRPAVLRRIDSDAISSFENKFSNHIVADGRGGYVNAITGESVKVDKETSAFGFYAREETLEKLTLLDKQAATTLRSKLEEIKTRAASGDLGGFDPVTSEYVDLVRDQYNDPYHYGGFGSTAKREVSALSADGTTFNQYGYSKDSMQPALIIRERVEETYQEFNEKKWQQGASYREAFETKTRIVEGKIIGGLEYMRDPTTGQMKAVPVDLARNQAGGVLAYGGMGQVIDPNRKIQQMGSVVSDQGIKDARAGYEGRRDSEVRDEIDFGTANDALSAVDEHGFTEYERQGGNLPGKSSSPTISANDSDRTVNAAGREIVDGYNSNEELDNLTIHEDELVEGTSKKTRIHYFTPSRREAEALAIRRGNDPRFIRRASAPKPIQVTQIRLSAADGTHLSADVLQKILGSSASTSDGVVHYTPSRLVETPNQPKFTRRLPTERGGGIVSPGRASSFAGERSPLVLMYDLETTGIPGKTPGFRAEAVQIGAILLDPNDGFKEVWRSTSAIGEGFMAPQDKKLLQVSQSLEGRVVRRLLFEQHEKVGKGLYDLKSFNPENAEFKAFLENNDFLNSHKDGRILKEILQSDAGRTILSAYKALNVNSIGKHARELGQDPLRFLLGQRSAKDAMNAMMSEVSAIAGDRSVVLAGHNINNFDNQFLVGKNGTQGLMGLVDPASRPNLVKIQYDQAGKITGGTIDTLELARKQTRTSRDSRDGVKSGVKDPMFLQDRTLSTLAEVVGMDKDAISNAHDAMHDVNMNVKVLQSMAEGTHGLGLDQATVELLSGESSASGLSRKPTVGNAAELKRLRGLAQQGDDLSVLKELRRVTAIASSPERVRALRERLQSGPGANNDTRRSASRRLTGRLTGAAGYQGYVQMMPSDLPVGDEEFVYFNKIDPVTKQTIIDPETGQAKTELFVRLQDRNRVPVEGRPGEFRSFRDAYLKPDIRGEYSSASEIVERQPGQSDWYTGFRPATKAEREALARSSKATTYMDGQLHSVEVSGNMRLGGKSGTNHSSMSAEVNITENGAVELTIYGDARRIQTADGRMINQVEHLRRQAEKAGIRVDVTGTHKQNDVYVVSYNDRTPMTQGQIDSTQVIDTPANSMVDNVGIDQVDSRLGRYRQRVVRGKRMVSVAGPGAAPSVAAAPAAPAAPPSTPNNYVHTPPPGMPRSEYNARVAMGATPGSFLMTGTGGRALIGAAVGLLAANATGQDTPHQMLGTIAAMGAGAIASSVVGGLVENHAYAGRSAFARLAGTGYGAAAGLIAAGAVLAYNAMTGSPARNVMRNRVTQAALMTAQDTANDLTTPQEVNDELVQFNDENGDPLDITFEGDEYDFIELVDENDEVLEFYENIDVT